MLFWIILGAVFITALIKIYLDIKNAPEEKDYWTGGEINIVDNVKCRFDDANPWYIIDEMRDINPLLKAIDYIAGDEFEKQENIRRNIGYNTKLISEREKELQQEVWESNIKLKLEADEFHYTMKDAKMAAMAFGRAFKNLGVNLKEINDYFDSIEESIKK